MSDLTFHWFLPTNGGDARDVVGGGHGVAATASTRPANVPYLGQIARSAEQLGFEGALTPAGAWCEDAWVATAMLSAVSERLKFLVAFRPGLVAPFLAAQMAGTFQNLSNNRLLLNVVVGGEDHEQRMFGDFSSKQERYESAGEFLHIVRSLWAGETVTFNGKHHSVENAALHQLPRVTPEVYFGGSSPAAGEVAAKYCDVYLTWGEPPAAVAEKIAWIESLAEAEGRELRYGIRLHSIARDTSAEAWAVADKLLAGISDEQISSIQTGLKRSASVGQQRMLELNGGSRDGLEVYPNLWAGVGLVRGGAGTAMVGSHTEIADLVEQYREVGITEFVMSGYPHLEESYHFGEGVLPELARRGLWQHPAPVPAGPASVPFGGPAPSSTPRSSSSIPSTAQVAAS